MSIRLEDYGDQITDALPNAKTSDLEAATDHDDVSAPVYTEGLLSATNDRGYRSISGERRRSRFADSRLMNVLMWILVLVVVVVLGAIGTYFMYSRNKIRTSLETECRDPYTGLGYIWRGKGDQDIRWIPYDSESPDLISNATTISASPDPPPSALARATTPYNSWLRLDNRETDERLTFARNRTVIFVGDSHDRKNIMAFCAQHPGADLLIPGYHLKASCKMEKLKFTLASWFMLGMAEESQDWYMTEEEGPRSVEERLKQLFVPDIANIGYPSLIVLNSFYWDLRYFGQYAQHYGHSNLTSDERPLTYSELEWHRSRLAVYVNIFRTTFPGVPIMFRLGQAHATNRNGGNVAVYQMNKSIRAIMSHLKVPIFEWATLLAGEEEYVDDQHLKDGKPAWLFGNMMLYYLKRAVTGNCEIYDRI